MSHFAFADKDLPKRVTIGTGFVLAGLIALIALLLTLSGRNSQTAIADMRQVIDRAKNTPNISAQGLSADAYYTGDTPQLAQASLQTDLQKLARDHSIQIDVIRAEQIEQIDGVIRLNLTLNGIAPEPELGAFLYGLSKREPIVIVDEISLRRARVTRRNKERRVAFQTRVYGVLQR